LEIESRENDAVDHPHTFVLKRGADGIKEGSTGSNQGSGVLEDEPLRLTHAGRIFVPGPQ